jgi:DNA-binding transcriptional ArsR family regulator
MGEMVYHKGLDFIFSIHKYFLTLEKNEKYENENAMIWKEYLEQPELVFVKNDLKTVFISRLFTSAIGEFVERNSLQALFDLDETGFLKIFADGINSDSLDRERIWELHDAYLSEELYVREEDFVIFNEAIFNTEVFRMRLINALKKAYSVFENRILSTEMMTVIEKVLKQHNENIKNGDETYTKHIINMKVFDSGTLPEGFKLYMLYFCSKNYLISVEGNFLIFSSDVYDKMKSIYEKLDIQLFLNVISDNTRLNLLKLLMKREYYGAELAKELEVTTANISHHIMKFSKLKIVKMRKGEKSRIYFSVLKEDVERYIDSLRDFLYEK